MIALGIDCATRTGWALVERREGRELLLGHGVLDLDEDMWESIKGFAASVGARGLGIGAFDVVAIELPWLGKNVDTTIKLARLCGRFEQALGFVDQVEVVRAVTWQSAILGRFGGKKRDGLKKAARIWARAMFGVELSEDESDAAGIAVWAARTMQAAERAA